MDDDPGSSVAHARIECIGYRGIRQFHVSRMNNLEPRRPPKFGNNVEQHKIALMTLGTMIYDDDSGRDGRRMR